MAEKKPKASEESETKESKSFRERLKSLQEGLDQLVAKLIPEPWLPTAFAAAVVVALLLLIIAIVSFGGDPELAAQARIEAAQTRTGELEKKLEETSRSLGETLNAKRKAEREQTKAQKKADALSKRAAKLDESLKTRNQQYAKLRKTKGEEAKIAERARVAFESIAEKVAAIPSAEKKLETVKRLRAASMPKLAGTPYVERLDAMVQRQSKQVYAEVMRNNAVTEDHDAAIVILRRGQQTLSGTDYAVRIHDKAERRKVAQMKDIYNDTMKRKLVMVKEHGAAMTILREAKRKLAGTPYEVRIHAEMERRQSTQTDETARAVYEAVIKKIKDSPTAYVDNRRALEVALRKVKGTRWAKKLEPLLDARQKTLATDVARARYENVMARIKKAPTEYDENIAAVEAALLETKGTRYEKSLEKRLKALRTERLERIGHKACEEAIAQIKSSPRDYSRNVQVLERLKAKAAGSRWEAKIGKYLTKQKALLERSTK